MIEKRHSSRVPFDSARPVSKEDLRTILEAGRWAPTAHNMQNFQIVVVDDERVLKDLAGIKRTVSETFIRENFEHLSFSEEELRRRKVGILGTNFPPSWRTPGVKPNPEEGGIRALPACPTLLVVLYDPSRRAPASEGDFFGAISLGCMTENLWLAANALGIDFHVVSPLASGSAEAEVKRILSIPAHLRVVYGIRLGYAATPPPYLRVRRDIEDFCHHNRFGTKVKD
ncbi:MAG TPA: nitroreductase family protein [bacterium]|nr:nitroreductase family protein [bacterium]